MTKKCRSPRRPAAPGPGAAEPTAAAERPLEASTSAGQRRPGTDLVGVDARARHQALRMPMPWRPDLLLPLPRPGLVHRLPARIDCDGDRHVRDLEFVDRLHARGPRTRRRAPCGSPSTRGTPRRRPRSGTRSRASGSTRSRPARARPCRPSRTSPVFSSIRSVNLSMRVAVVGPAGPTASPRTGSTGPT